MIWLVPALGLQILDLSHNALAVDDLAKDDVLLVQMWRWNGRNEELGTVGGWIVVSLVTLRRPESSIHGFFETYQVQHLPY